MPKKTSHTKKVKPTKKTVKKIPAKNSSKKSSLNKFRIEDYTRGWIVGDFDPVVLKTKDFEVMVRTYKKGEIDAGHVHKVADEITVVVTGKHMMNGHVIIPGDIIHLKPGDVMNYFECIEDGTLVAIKRPSVMGDKYPL